MLHEKAKMRQAVYLYRLLFYLIITKLIITIILNNLNNLSIQF